MTGAELLVDLLAATIARRGALRLATVVHEAMRVFPLLEGACSTAYVNLRPPLAHDFRPTRGGHPQPRERIDATAQSDTARELLARSQLTVIAIAGDSEALVPMLQTQDLQRHLILYGETRAAAWSATAPMLKAGLLTPLDLAGVRLLLSREAVETLGGRGVLQAPFGVKLAEALVQAQPSRWSIQRSDQRLNLRMVADPLDLVATCTEMTAHNTMHESRALFSARGLGAILIPWSQPSVLQLLLRNVRSRVDDLMLALDDQLLVPTNVEYTEHGALLTIAVPAVPSTVDALLHLALPRTAVPNDGYCDVGAVQVTVELA